MRRILIASALAALMALGACSKPEQEKAKADLDTAADKTVATADKTADKIAAGAKDLANDPKVKAAGEDMKQAADKAGDKVAEATGEALVKAGSKIKQAASDEPEKK